METTTMNLQNANNHFISENKFRILFFILLFVLSSMRIFGQTTDQTIAIENKEQVSSFENQTQTAIVSLDSQIDFVSWFMGCKQSQGNEIESSSQFGSMTTKKQILTSGITPNKVLYRTFMKRVISQDAAIV